MVALVRGRDHKLYPLGLPRPAAEHARLVGLSHTLRCRRRLPFREIQRVLAAEFGIRRSLGAICRDLRVYQCDYCAARPAAPPPEPAAVLPAPPPRPRARAYEWR
jgi:hypothetical protein